MSKFGWSLPPGCSTKDLPGCDPASQRLDALYNRIYGELDRLGISEEMGGAIADAMVSVCGDVYQEGYQQGMADEALAEQHRQEYRVENA